MKYLNGIHASPYSPESIMTKNPIKIENILHENNGIDDK
jgi:hypothetical protein